MKAIQIIAILTLLFSLNGFSQNISIRVEKQAMSTPMTTLDEIFFMNYYYAKPMNIKFNGVLLNMHYDNGQTFAKKTVTEVDRQKEFENDQLVMETIVYTDNANVSDTISLVLDYQIGYVQVVLPTKNSKDEYVGYTSYRQFVKEEGLALK
jgi:hypothetical protein